MDEDALWLSWIVPMVVVIGAVVGGLYFVRARGGGHAGLAGPPRNAATQQALWASFFAQTGYRLPEQPHAPLEHQAAVLEHRMMEMMRGHSKASLVLVRDFNGLQVTNESYFGLDGAGTQVHANCWRMPLPSPARFGWHVAEKKFSGAQRLIREIVTNSERSWSPAFAQRVESGNPACDARFNVYSDQPDAARALLQRPGVQETLMSFHEVDLVVRAGETAFFDPMQANLRGTLGGSVGMMAAAGDPNRMMQASIDVHNRVAQLLYGCAHASA